MSSNTNTLFWVITGAVIVLAVFLLMSNENNQLEGITNKFSSLFVAEKQEEDEKIEEEESLIEDYSKYFVTSMNLGSNYTKIEPCGANYVVVDGYKIGAHEIYEDLATDDIMARFMAFNDNDYKADGTIELQVYECGTDRKIFNSVVSLFFLNAHGRTDLSINTGGGFSENSKYYLKAILRKN